MKISIPIILFLGAILAGCQSYKPLPLNPDELLVSLTADRMTSKHISSNTLSFVEAARQMSDNNMTLRVLEGDYKKLKAISDIPTPWSNPELEAGVATGHRLDNTVASKTQPFVGLGFSIPLGPRLSREDDLNAIRAANALAALATSHRDLYLDLRSAYIRYALAFEALDARDQVIDTVKRTRLAAVKLEGAGSIGSIELTQIGLDADLEDVERTGNQMTVQDVNAELSELLGLSGSLLGKTATALPKTPDALPPLAELKTLMLTNNPELTKLARIFKENDATIRLELAKQYPDIKLGTGFEQEVGEKTQIFAIGIGIEFPLFDLNRQGIAAAFHQRQNTLTAYKGELNRKLSELDGLIKRYHTQRDQYVRLNSSILPKSKALLKNAARAVDAGTWNFMRFLDMQRTHRKLVMREISSKAQLWNTILAIETLVGYPLCLFEEETDLIPTVNHGDIKDTDNDH